MKRCELHILAEARGVIRGHGSDCCVCGESPFDAFGSRRKVLPNTFADHDLMGSADKVCCGCVALMAGRPGDDPPPLRTANVAILKSGEAVYPDRQGLYRLMADPGEVRVISWASSRKKHHWLRAGLSTPGRLLIGSDDGQIEYRPVDHSGLLHAVVALLASPTGTASILTRTAIRTGEYHPEAIRKFGVRIWAPLDAIVSRWRPSLLVDLLTIAAPVTLADPQKEDAVIDKTEEKAAALLAHIAIASEMRRKDGKMFWGGFYRHRIERFRHLPLSQMASRLMDVVRASPTDPAVAMVTEYLATWTEEESAEVAVVVRDKAALVLALAFEMIKGTRVPKQKDLQGVLL